MADPRSSPDPAHLISQAKGAGIVHALQGGIDPEDWERQLKLHAQHGPYIQTCFGLHPWFVAANAGEGSSQFLDQHLPKLIELLPEACAIGELGLDFGKRFGPETHTAQLEVFEVQLDLALAQDKPLVLHVVHAHEAALGALKRHGAGRKWKGLVHSFGANREIAERYIQLGLLISVGGSLLKDGYTDLKKAVIDLPDEALVVESESPGDQDNPLRLFEVARALGRLRGKTHGLILDISRQNMLQHFEFSSEPV